jgi:predicted porin
MKKILLSVLIAALLFSVCSAEVLLTPPSEGKDNFAIQGFYSSTPVKLSDSNIIAFGPKIIYGVTDDFDMIGKVGSVTFSGTGATEIGIAGKYTIPKSTLNSPLDLAAVLSYDSISGKDINQGTTSIGMIASRLLRPDFTVYGALYGMQNSNKYTGSKSSNSNDFMWGFGAKYKFNNKLSALAELMLFTMASDSYQTFSMGVQYEM